MFWIALGLIIASLIGFIILRVETSPVARGGFDSYYDIDDTDNESDVTSDQPLAKTDDTARREHLNVLRYTTYTLMGAGVIMEFIYAFTTV